METLTAKFAWNPFFQQLPRSPFHDIFRPVVRSVHESACSTFPHYCKNSFSLDKIDAKVHKDDKKSWSFRSHFPPAGTSLAGVGGGLSSSGLFLSCLPTPLMRSPISVPIIATIKYRNHLFAMYLPREARRTERTNPNSIFLIVSTVSSACQLQ